MATSFSWNGTTYSVPAAGELNWSSLSTYLIALGAGAQSTSQQKWGIRVATATPVIVAAATDCVIVSKLSSAGAVAITLPAGASKQIFCIVDGTGDAEANNITVTPNGSETINGAATYVLGSDRAGIIIAYSGTEWIILAKFTAAGEITNSDISATAAIDFSKLATLAAANVLVGSAGNVATSVAVTGDISISNAGVTAIASGVVVNADVNASAAIDHSKLAALTAANVLVGNASNVATSVAVTGDVSISNAGVVAITADSIVNADVNTSAAIAYSKLALGSSIVNTDVNASASIAYSKLNLGTSIVNADVNASAAIAYSKLNLGTSIVNADVSASAAIVDTKLATISTASKVSNSATTAASANTASAIVARDGSGNFAAGTITANLTGNASGTAANVTGTVAIANGGTGQTSANDAVNALLPSQAANSGKVLSTDATNTSWISVLTSPMTTLGDIIIGAASGVASRLGIGTDLQILRSNGTTLAWTDGLATASESGLVSTTTQTIAGDKTLTGTTVIGTATGLAQTGLQVNKTRTNNNDVTARFHYDSTINGSGQAGGIHVSTGDATPVGFRYIQFDFGGTKTAVGTIAGSISNNADTSAVFYNTTSDARLKTDVKTSSYGLDSVMKMQSVDFKWVRGNYQSNGFIAQDLYKVYPHAVSVGDETQQWGVDYGKLTPVLVKAIQDQQKIIEDLEKRLASLEGK